MGLNQAKSERESYKFKVFTFKKLNLKKSLQPKPRSGHRIICDLTGHYFYSYGGFNPFLSANEQLQCNLINGVLFKEIWKFNIAKHEWKKIKFVIDELPNQLASSAVVGLGNLILIHGGTGIPFGQTCSNNTLLFNLSNFEIKNLECSGDMPTPQYGQAVTLHNKQYLYTIGGTTGFEYSMDVHRLDLTTKQWEAVYICSGVNTREPEPRYRHETAFYNNYVLVFGGGTVGQVFPFQELPAFNIINRSWEFLSTIPDRVFGFPQPRRCHSIVQADGVGDAHSKILIAGGSNGTKNFADAWVLDLHIMKWAKLPTRLNSPTFFHSACITPYGQMYVFGGLTETRANEDILQSDRNNDIHTMWITIPKLSEMSWDALLFYARDKIIQTPTNVLRDNGVPQHFIDRIVC